jgi:hypothetical protein
MDQLRKVGSVTSLLLLASVVFTGQGCGVTRATSAAPLANAERSTEALANRFLDALARSDAPAIRSLRLTKEEFATVVWPELPASKLPNVTVDWVWSQATLKSEGGLSKVLPKHGGKRYQLVSVRFEQTEKYPSYKVLKAPTLTVRDETGATSDVQLFGSMLEVDGQYKLFGFNAD